jgi:hypothetical protein
MEPGRTRRRTLRQLWQCVRAQAIRALSSAGLPIRSTNFQACPRLYSRITRIRTREIRIPTDHSLWVTHRRSPKLAWGHSRSRGKADFTFNSESRHRAQWARSVLPIHFYSGPHVQPLPCTATDGRSSLRTRRRCFVIVPLPFVTVPCPFIIVPWRLNFFFCAVAFSAYPLTVLT